MSDNTASTVIDRAWPAEGFGPQALRLVTITLLGSLLLTFSAKVQVPFYPVPMTMQTAVVFLLGLTLGPKLALATIGAYLLEGALGLPVFSGTPQLGVGIAYMVGPTGGYLLGFLLAGAICGIAARWGLQRMALVVAVFLATVAIYLPGLAWLSAFVGLEKAISLGLEPFILGDLVKLALVVVLVETGVHRKAR